MRRALLSLPIALALLAAGCAGDTSSAGEFEGEQRAVADKVEKLQSAGEARDGQAICDEVLARSLRDQIKAAGADCAQELDKAIQDADDFDLEVESVTVRGDRAIARVKGRDGGGDRVRTFRFVREGGDWRVASLG
jgi:dihydroxyacetone kinase